MTKRQIADLLKEFFGDQIIQLVIAQEEHLNGELHFHGYVQMDRRTFISARMVAEALGTYAHIHGVDDKWLEYLLKFDEDPLVEGTRWNSRQEVLDYLESTSKKMTDRISEFLASHTLAEAQQIWPGYVMQHWNALNIYKTQMDNIRAQERQQLQLLPWEPIPIDEAMEQHNEVISRWLNYIASFNDDTNTEQIGKRAHLYIQAPKNAGKTRLQTTLKKFFRVFEYHWNQSDWQDDFNSEDYDLILFEEFNSNRYLDLPRLNNFLDGGGKVSRRNKAPLLRNKRIPALFLSNSSVDINLYQFRAPEIAAFKSRVTEITLKGNQQIVVLEQHWERNLRDFDPFATPPGPPPGDFPSVDENEQSDWEDIQ